MQINMKKYLILLLFLPVFCLGQRYEYFLKMNSTSPRDMSGLGIGTTCANMTLGQGVIDGDLVSTTGNTPRIKSSNFQIDTTNGAITINFWAYPSAVSRTETFITHDNAAAAWGFEVLKIGTVDLRVWRITNNTTGATTSTTYAGFFTGFNTRLTMITIVMKFSSTNTGYIKVYRNGDLFASTTGIALYIGGASYPLHIATFYNTNPLVGAIDETFIVNYEMNQQSIKTIYNNKLGMY